MLNEQQWTQKHMCCMLANFWMEIYRKSKERDFRSGRDECREKKEWLSQFGYHEPDFFCCRNETKKIIDDFIAHLILPQTLHMSMKLIARKKKKFWVKIILTTCLNLVLSYSVHSTFSRHSTPFLSQKILFIYFVASISFNNFYRDVHARICQL